MSYTIRSGSKPILSLAENDLTQSILQNLFLLLETRKGTIPMYRNFGLSQSFLDKPLAVATALATAEIREAVETYEPRATLLDVQVEAKPNGNVSIILEVEI